MKYLKKFNENDGTIFEENVPIHLFFEDDTKEEIEIRNALVKFVKDNNHIGNIPWDTLYEIDPELADKTKMYLNLK